MTLTQPNQQTEQPDCQVEIDETLWEIKQDLAHEGQLGPSFRLDPDDALTDEEKRKEELEAIKRAHRLPRQLENHVFHLAEGYPEQTLELMDRMVRERFRRPMVRHMRGSYLKRDMNGNPKAACATGFILLSFHTHPPTKVDGSPLDPEASLRTVLRNDYPNIPISSFINAVTVLNDETSLTIEGIRDLFKKIIRGIH